jgi:hypothetical protein
MLANLNLAATYKRMFDRAHTLATPEERATLDRIREGVEQLSAEVADRQATE